MKILIDMGHPAHVHLLRILFGDGDARPRSQGDSQG